MRFFFVFLLMGMIVSVLVPAQASSQPIAHNPDTFIPVFKPTINVTELKGSIRIDGDMTDSGWEDAVRVDHFTESSPGNNTRPDVKSAAMMTYDESHVYFALIAWDNPEEIRVSMTDRDAIFRDDYFGVMLDTYGDATWGYEIFVNPIGIQGDLRMMGSGQEDMSYDLVFESQGIVTDSGYQVELAIPFASLRFPNKDLQTWNVNFWRDRQRENRYRYSWAAKDREDPCFLCAWGPVVGVKGVKPGSNIDILPNFIGYQSGEVGNRYEPDSEFDNSKADGELSLNVRYGLSSNSSLEFTVNPDFSQIESDAGQIDVNSAFALYFPERRPFFQEGSDLYQTPINIVHTRSINDPSMAVKFTSQFGRSSVAYMYAQDENTPFVLPLLEQSAPAALGKSRVNILRARQTFGADSFIGLSLTDRRFNDFSRSELSSTGGSNSVYGIDGQIRLSGNHRIVFQALGSYTEEVNAPGLIDTTNLYGIAQSYFDNRKHTVALDGEKFAGEAFSISLQRNAFRWYYSLSSRSFSPTFRADNGFINRVGQRFIDFSTGFNWRPNREWLVQWNPSISVGRLWDYDAKVDLNPGNYLDGTRDEWGSINLFMQFKGQTNLSVSYLQSRERFSGSVFPGISRLNVNLSTRPTAALNFGVYGTYGRSIYRRRFSEWDEIIPLVDRVTPNDSLIRMSVGPEMGLMNDFGLWADFKITQRLSVVPEFNFSKMDHLDGFMNDNPDSDREIYSGYILRTRISYQFTRELFFRLIGEYNDFVQAMSFEPLITYKVNPFTVFYAGVNGNFQHFDHKNDNYRYLNKSQWDLSQRQYFIKIQYLFRV